MEEKYGHEQVGGVPGEEGQGGRDVEDKWAGTEGTSRGARCVGHTGWNLLIFSDCKYCPQNVEARSSKVQLVNSGIDLFVKEIAWDNWKNIYF